MVSAFTRPCGGRRAGWRIAPTGIFCLFALIPVLSIASSCTLTGPAVASPGAGIAPIRNVQGVMDVPAAGTFIRLPSPGRFSICHGHTCRQIETVSLTAAQWDGVRSVFVPGVPTAAAERRNIASAISLLEEMVGEQAGTWNDRAENFRGLGMTGQMDCVDESTNSTVYLWMMREAGLLQHHQVGPRISRGVSRLLVPHFTATIAETATGRRFAVDSWFRDNGDPPFIVDLAEWRRGWKPGVDPGKVAAGDK